MTDLRYWPDRGWIMPELRGSFQPAEFEPGAVKAEFLHVKSYPDGATVDVVAWDPHAPGRWWTFRDVCAVAGEYELNASWWEEDRPARLVATPAEHRADPRVTCCIIDWSADLNAAFGLAPAVECSTEALALRLHKTLVAQAVPRLKIRVAGLHRAAA
jgi:hypothetical protein